MTMLRYVPVWILNAKSTPICAHLHALAWHNAFAYELASYDNVNSYVNYARAIRTY